MSEEYIFLDFDNETYFFFHTLSNNNFIKTISHEIYNILVKDKLLEDFDKNVIIYEINPETDDFNIISIQHINKKNTISKYYTLNLSENFIKLIKNLTNKKMYVVKYNYEDKSYGIYKPVINYKDFFENNIPNGTPPFDKIEEIFTSIIF